MRSKGKQIQGYFTEVEIPGMTHQEFQIAMIGLIEKGLMEMVEKDGVKYYRPTLLAHMISPHLDSNPKNKN